MSLTSFTKAGKMERDNPIDKWLFSFLTSNLPDESLSGLFIRTWAQCDNQSGRRNSVQDTQALHFVTAGSGFLYIDGKRYGISAGTVFLLSPQTHVSYYPRKGEKLTYTWCWLGGNAVSRLFTEIGLDRLNPVLSLQDHPEVLETVQAISDKFAGGHFSSLYSIHAAWQLVDCMMEAFAVKKNDATSKTTALAIRNFIENSEMSDNSVEQLAHEFKLSRISVYRIFKAAFNISPKKFIDNMRFEKACQLLSNSRMNMTEIAEKCGFSSLGNFSSAFKKHTGMSPGVWKTKF